MFRHCILLFYSSILRNYRSFLRTSIILNMFGCWTIYLIYFLKKKRIKKNWAPKMIRARNVCNPSRLRSPSYQSQLLNLFGCWIMYLIYFHPKNKRIKKRTELLRWYAREMSVIPEYWGVLAANLSLWICSDAE
jgi:hypothetical protein